jgi:type II secretory pathway component PulL
MTTISPLLLAQSNQWLVEVSAFFVDSEREDVNDLQRDGATAVIDLAAEFANGNHGRNRALVAQVIGRLSDIQVRDFALGSHDNETLDNYWAMWRYLIRIAPVGYVAPLATLVAAIAYEKDESALAEQALARAFEDDPLYSLATLLRRVFAAGWPKEAFASMRVELHPKVCAGIFMS